jgi:hypothetical protein
MVSVLRAIQFRSTTSFGGEINSLVPCRRISHVKQEVLGRTNSPTFPAYVTYLKYLNLI